MSCCGNSGGSYWDTLALEWRCKDCGSSQSNDPSYLGSSLKPIPVVDSKYIIKRCECGADKTYGPGSGMHSATMPCPLYKKP